MRVFLWPFPCGHAGPEDCRHGIRKRCTSMDWSRALTTKPLNRMDWVHELNRIINKQANNTTSEFTIPLEVLLKQSGHGNSSDGHAQILKSIPELLGLLISYTAVILCALFGNSMVCHVIYKHKRLHTVTNLFIANLSISDMLITVFNIPFNLVRHILDEWPFGSVMCGLVNFILMASVYVSTFTMAAISIDRYIVIVYPLRPRITFNVGICVVLITWAFGSIMALPFVIFAKAERVELFLSSATRCRLRYPDPADKHEQIVTLTTVISQYVLPMTIIAIAYGRIVRKLWIRPMIGQPNPSQHVTQSKVKHKTEKMLIIIIVIFSVCWMPLNLYHLLTDLHPDAELFRYNSTVYIICHWIAMSSVCYNPFVYCWFNASFRAELRSWFSCCFKRSSRVHPGVEVNGNIVRLDRLGRRKSLAHSSNGVSRRASNRPKRCKGYEDREIVRESSFVDGGAIPRGALRRAKGASLRPQRQGKGLGVTLQGINESPTGSGFQPPQV